VNRYSSLLLAFALCLLIAAPWVEPSARLGVYHLGVACALGFGFFRLLND